jgi:tetratricopeptide (TPR) repeat protein
MEVAWAYSEGTSRLDAVLAELVDALGYIFDRRGLWEFGGHWNERAIALRRESESSRNAAALSRALFRRAGLLKNRGQYDKAKQLYLDSFQVNREAGELLGQAASLHELASIERTQGNPREARRLFLTRPSRIDDQAAGLLDWVSAPLGVIRGEIAFHGLDQTVHLGPVGMQADGHAFGIVGRVGVEGLGAVDAELALQDAPRGCWKCGDLLEELHVILPRGCGPSRGFRIKPGLHWCEHSPPLHYCHFAARKQRSRALHRGRKGRSRQRIAHATHTLGIFVWRSLVIRPPIGHDGLLH